VQSVLIGTELTAEFASKEVTGNGGCNTFGGPYEATGTTISIGPIASTLILCADQAVNAQEQQYFAALELARSYRVTQNRLDLLREGGTIAVTFERTPG
jgi:heat shock protein HslJ